MLIFAKDIGQRDHRHELEDKLPELKQYMEYQRKLFPYTVVRAGLDLAYKEIDDIMNFIDNDYRPPADSSRQEYPSDVEQWYKNRFPWTSAFLKMEDMHFTLVTLVKAMDSFRTHESANAYHWPVLYDSAHNIIQVYNSLIRDDPGNSRDIHLSNAVEVNFDDFINNYWFDLDFMVFSQADYPHARHQERKNLLEEEIKDIIAEGVEPLVALEKLEPPFKLDDATLKLLRRDSVETRFLELKSSPETGNQFDGIYKEYVEDPQYGRLSIIDAEYLTNHPLAAPA
ncbi:MAG: hypothetical protein HOI59_10740 [Nitrospina sp.]|jgi:hypothetical protein|nr:hypothetical protein [Nitrospina sp.]MBT3413997.1 hypothetical protein [Nitrospina sp.]MBT3858040.1 hypothetical protein [Nitrospina sp.]MBT4105884.1 hypothetical protein [Nitrospina sp.]MBT4390039.1 hypothetical protein [Nitrospina sp.]